VTGPLREIAGIYLLDVRVTPKASRNEITGLYAASDGALSLAVKVCAVPEKGKANAAVIATLAKEIRMSQSTFAQVAGDINRHKTFQIIGNVAVVAAYVAKMQRKDDHGEDH
jgi:uncharacterized protein